MTYAAELSAARSTRATLKAEEKAFLTKDRGRLVAVLKKALDLPDGYSNKGKLTIDEDLAQAKIHYWVNAYNVKVTFACEMAGAAGGTDLDGDPVPATVRAIAVAEHFGLYFESDGSEINYGDFRKDGTGVGLSGVGADFTLSVYNADDTGTILRGNGAAGTESVTLAAFRDWFFAELDKAYAVKLETAKSKANAI